MLPAGIQQHLFAKQIIVGQRIGIAVLRNHAEVVVAVENAALDGGNRAGMQMDGDIGGGLVKAAKRGGQAGLRVGDGFFKQRDIEFAAEVFMDAADGVAEGIGGVQQLHGGAVDFATFGGEFETAAAAAAQHQTEPGFQVFHMAANGGERKVEAQFGLRKTAAVGHAFEDAQQAQILVAEFAEGRRVCFHDC